MKKCLLCGLDDQADATVTCPNDGEASWMPSEKPAPLKNALVALADEAPTPDTAPKRRSRK